MYLAVLIAFVFLRLNLIHNLRGTYSLDQNICNESLNDKRAIEINEHVFTISASSIRFHLRLYSNNYEVKCSSQKGGERDGKFIRKAVVGRISLRFFPRSIGITGYSFWIFSASKNALKFSLEFVGKLLCKFIGELHVIELRGILNHSNNCLATRLSQISLYLSVNN